MGVRILVDIQNLRYTDKDGHLYIDWKKWRDGRQACCNCGDKLREGGVLQRHHLRENPLYLCSGCIIIQSVPQIIEAYEQCSEKLVESEGERQWPIWTLSEGDIREVHKRMFAGKAPFEELDLDLVAKYFEKAITNNLGEGYDWTLILRDAIEEVI